MINTSSFLRRYFTAFGALQGEQLETEYKDRDKMVRFCFQFWPFKIRQISPQAQTLNKPSQNCQRSLNFRKVAKFRRIW